MLANKLCPVCTHPERAEIERAILSIAPSNPQLTLNAIADAFGVTVNDLQVHALMHTPLSLDFSSEAEVGLADGFRQKAGVASHQSEGGSSSVSDNTSGKQRLADKLNMRESDLLLATANEYFTTLSTLGNRIKRYAGDSSEGSDTRLVNFCTNAMVNLYLGTGAELRKAIDAIKELNTSINGSHDSANAGLAALASALSASKSGSATDGPQFLDETTKDIEREGDAE